ncbi:hypothetical protein [Palleronia abyssalis]|uniref:hypothetical protein n=1 Tax=Palleronia abyssalis TaxID=1501240 RepID=UPI0015E80A5F|nr:hypothetical protein [Palleronia abyssalis]
MKRARAQDPGARFRPDLPAGLLKIRWSDGSTESLDLDTKERPDNRPTLAEP